MIKHNFKTSVKAAALVAGLVGLAGSASATVVDLQNNDSGTINGALFTESFQQPTGTGVIQPFLREQNTPSEQGYNTSGGTPFDDKAGPWTHDLRFSDLQTSTTTVNGVKYFQILLDVNEPGGSKSLISLDHLQFYTSPTGSQTTTNVSSLGTLRYNLDAGTDGQVIIDAARNHGSGSGDVNLFIPVSDFAGAKANDFVYMYAAFGQADTLTNPDGSAGGFEEFALVANVTPVPELSALFPIVGLMVALVSTNVLRRRRMAQLSA
jgi:hypothetical protein